LKNCTGRVVNVEGNITMNVRKICHEVVRIYMWGQGRTYFICPSRKVSSQSLDTKLRLTTYIQGVQLKSGPHFNMKNLFTKIYNMLYYTTDPYLQ